jgi:chorismate mutase
VTDELTPRLREQIAERDRAILEAMNTRLRLVAELKRHKETHAVEFTDAGQEERLLDALESANDGPLSSDGVRALFTHVLALTKRELDASGG